VRAAHSIFLAATAMATTASSDDVAVLPAVPLLVRVLGGNPLTTATVLSYLNTTDATHLRRLHPAVAAAVAVVPWDNTKALVYDVARWRAALPCAVSAALAPAAVWGAPSPAALDGIRYLDLERSHRSVTDEFLLCLPRSLRHLDVQECTRLTARASFVHLTALESLDCAGTSVLTQGMSRLPLSLHTLRMDDVYWKHRRLPPTAVLVTLRRCAC